MSEWIADSPYVARHWCPGCEPSADPLREVLDERRCGEHGGSLDGADDGRMQPRYLSGSSEVDAATNRRFCAFIHRKEEPT